MTSKRSNSKVKVAQKAKRKTSAEPVCIIEGCERPQFTRDICHACYSVHRRSVLRGDTTWEALEAAGLIGPRKIAPATAARQAAGLTDRKPTN
jgi:hypothetical protein